MPLVMGKSSYSLFEYLKLAYVNELHFATRLTDKNKAFRILIELM
jgi:hypothetical protein